MPPFELCAPHAGTHPLDDQVALEFSDRPDDDHNGPAQGPSGVDLFTEADELDIEPVQLVGKHADHFIGAVICGQPMNSALMLLDKMPMGRRHALPLRSDNDVAARLQGVRRM